ncbi:hypothetical protein L1286_01450 [Pseudoalteromonas sp. SMS1]|uniref:hypothetical protein n=1 Tax=Pseudoalteromonas sp. SMS1 TaxID=2908894 RepID=UPI001F264132|nr:hypothetical protein [Pseudoalteromonas sp. SMS1]MCF2856125.1 hypothetical protein [Pseudoalteromonas sp. SMS1]
MNRWILFLMLFSSSVIASTQQLSQRQCARYTDELEFLRQNSALQVGEDARLLRLIERLDTYCKTPKQRVQEAAALNQPSHRIFGSDTFKNQATRERWLAYFKKPKICHHGDQSFTSAVKCAEQVAAQRQAFELQFRTEQAQQNQTPLNQSTPVANEAINQVPLNDSHRRKIRTNTDIGYADNLPKTHSDEYVDKGHFDRFAMWLSIILTGYVIIELVKYAFTGRTTKQRRQRRSFISTHKLLTSKLDNKKYIVLYRSMSPLLDELDIDGIVLSPFGIFVLIYCPQSGVIEADIQGEMWNVIQAGSSNFFLNPANAAKVRVANLNKCMGVESGVRCMIVFDDESEFYPGKPFNCFQSKEVALEVMRYTQYMFSYEQLRYFEQRLFSAESALHSDTELVSHSS